MERIIVKTNDEFNPDTKVFGDFHESYGGKFSKVNIEAHPSFWNPSAKKRKHPWAFR